MSPRAYGRDDLVVGVDGGNLREIELLKRLLQFLRLLLAHLARILRVRIRSLTVRCSVCQQVCWFFL